MGKGNDLSPESASVALAQRLEKLQAKSPEELAALPAWSSEEALVDGFPSRITTYRDEAQGGALRIVLQLNANEKPFLVIFRSRQGFVEGFDALPSGPTPPLPHHAIY